MRCISCGNKVVDEKDFFTFQDISVSRMKRIFFSDFSSFFSRTTGLMTSKEFFGKRGEGWNIRESHIFGEKFGMIWSSQHPISEADRGIYYDVWIIGEFLFHMSKKFLKVDMVDMIMDKFKTMNFSLHFFVIQCSYDDFIERKIRNSMFIVLGF